jgi:Iron dependent repressor, N-terminal DNA binding domain
MTCNTFCNFEKANRGLRPLVGVVALFAGHAMRSSAASESTAARSMRPQSSKFMRFPSGTSATDTRGPLIEGQGPNRRLAGPPCASPLDPIDRANLFDIAGTDRELNRIAVLIFGLMLARFYFYDTGKCVVGRVELAERYHVSKASVHDALKQLRARGYLTWDKSTGGRSKKIDYTILRDRLPFRKQKGQSVSSIRKNGREKGRLSDEVGRSPTPHTDSRTPQGLLRKQLALRPLTPSSVPERRSQAAEIETREKLSPEEIKRRDEVLSKLQAQFAKTAERMTRRNR